MKKYIPKSNHPWRKGYMPKVNKLVTTIDKEIDELNIVETDEQTINKVTQNKGQIGARFLAYRSDK